MQLTSVAVFMPLFRGMMSGGDSIYCFSGPLARFHTSTASSNVSTICLGQATRPITII